MNRTLTRLTRAATDPDRLPDGQLLAAFLSGRDEPAFAALVRRHGPMVLAVCRRVLRHQQDAEDAFQATFLVLARRAADVWPREAIGSWLYGVAYRVALKARAVRARRHTREQPLDTAVQPVAPDPAPSDLAEVLDRAIRRLPGIYRSAVVACDLEGRSRKDAAELLGWKEGTLSGRLARARELLASRLRRAGLTLPAGGVAAILGIGGTVDAGLVERTVKSADGNLAAGVSAPVAALTEGVVRGMVLAKFKTAAAAVVMVCGIGFGVWASSGAGDGPGPVGKGEGPTADPPKAGEKPPPAKLPTDLERMQGTWRVAIVTTRNMTRVTDDDPAPLHIEVEGDRLSWRYPPGWALTTRNQTVVLDPAKDPKQIDLVTSDGTRQLGVYEFPAGVAGAVPVELRLALSPEGGERPAGFRDPPEGVAVYGLVRVAPPKKDPPPAPGTAGPRVEEAQAELRLIQKEIEALATRKEIDPVALDRLRMRLDAVQALLRSPKEVPDPQPGAADLLAEARARREVERQRAEVIVKEAEVGLEAARADLAAAQAAVELAQAQLEAARKQAAELNPDPPAVGKRYTIRVRTLIGQEQTEGRPLGPNETVMSGITARFKLKATELPPLDVWVLRPQGRDLSVLFVDWEDVARGGAKTNYQLLPGDVLVVQHRPRP